MQGVRRVEHLPARSDKERVQGVRRVEHLPAQSEKEPVQGVRRVGHLPAQSEKGPLQDVQSRQGRVHAAGSRGALDSTRTGFCAAQLPWCPIVSYGSTRLRRGRASLFPYFCQKHHISTHMSKGLCLTDRNKRRRHKRVKQNIYERRSYRILNCKQPGTRKRRHLPLAVF